MSVHTFHVFFSFFFLSALAGDRIVCERAVKALGSVCVRDYATVENMVLEIAGQLAVRVTFHPHVCGPGLSPDAVSAPSKS